MRLLRTIDDKAVIADEMKNRPPFGPGFTTDEIQKTAKVEIWVSDFKDATDKVEFRGFGPDGQPTVTKSVAGY
jgi:hypothetical protein